MLKMAQAAASGGIKFIKSNAMSLATLCLSPT
jgi:hypothetical protein